MNKYLSVLAFLVVSNLGFADDRPYLALDRFSLQVMKFSCNRDPQTPDVDCRSYRGRVATNFDLELFRYGFWRNKIHGEGTAAAFTTVGWNYEIGIKLTSQIEMFQEHHSRHVLDRKQPQYWNEELGEPVRSRFPVEDSYGIRIIFYERKK